MRHAPHRIAILTIVDFTFPTTGFHSFFFLHKVDPVGSHDPQPPSSPSPSHTHISPALPSLALLRRSRLLQSEVSRPVLRTRVSSPILFNKLQTQKKSFTIKHYNNTKIRAEPSRGGALRGTRWRRSVSSEQRFRHRKLYHCRTGPIIVICCVRRLLP